LADKAEKNIADDQTMVKVSLTEVIGLPEDILGKLEKVPGEPQSRMLPLTKTIIYPALKSIEDD